MEISKSRSIGFIFFKFIFFKFVLLTHLMFSLDNVWAQESGGQGFSAITQLNLLSDSNIQRNINEISDDIVQIAPQFSYLNMIGKHEFSASYTGIYTKYSELSQYDYENHVAAIGILFDHSAQLSTQFAANYEDAAEKPGLTNGVLANVTEFNHFSKSHLSAAMLYGTQSSKGQIIVNLDYNTVEYSNNDQKFRNADTTSVTGSYFYRIAPSTRLLFELGTADFDYTDVEGTNDQSNQQNTYSTGIEWASSAQTTSVFKLGYQTKDFENSAFTNLDGLSYSLDFIWVPKSYTQITFGAARSANESAIEGAAGYISKTYSIDLEHELTEATLLNSKMQYSDNDLAFRLDTNTLFQIGLTYSAKYWLDITLSYALENRESNDPLFDYDSEVIQLSFITKFD